MSVKKILIADDEVDVLTVLEKKLRGNDFEVLALSKGSEIIEQALTFKPDLLILDIVMPGTDGYTAALALRKEESFKNTPIIFMTAKELDYSGIKKRVAELGGCDFILKPCAFEDLLTKVKTISSAE